MIALICVPLKLSLPSVCFVAYEELSATGSDLSLKLSVLLPLTVDRVQNIFCFDHELDRHDEWSRALVIERTV